MSSSSSPWTPQVAKRPATRSGFGIAIICALTHEADAVQALFDAHWDDGKHPYDKASGDPNTYTTGAIGRHNVVLAHMPSTGKANAATVAAHCRASFPNVRLALVVGVCGGVPFGPGGREIMLGDVLISEGVIQFDIGRWTPDGFARYDSLLRSLGRPSLEISAFLAMLKLHRKQKMLRDKITHHLGVIQRRPQLKAHYPSAVNDVLFEAAYRHVEAEKSCAEAGCDGQPVIRKRLEGIAGGVPQPEVHFGLIASGDAMMEDGEERDLVASRESVLGFEMVSAGVWDSIPCVVIKGVSDYADSHKSEAWQPYAAATSAACMKAFLEDWVPYTPPIPEPYSTAETTIQEQASDQSETIPSSSSVVPFNRDRKSFEHRMLIRQLYQRSSELTSATQAILDILEGDGQEIGATDASLRGPFGHGGSS